MSQPAGSPSPCSRRLALGRAAAYARTREPGSEVRFPQPQSGIASPAHPDAPPGEVSLYRGRERRPKAPDESGPIAWAGQRSFSGESAWSTDNGAHREHRSPRERLIEGRVFHLALQEGDGL